ncbi:uncharacterized protein [Henckelia pumila]|uniref:uncharacterized protein isoform X2 n=1 Tax=Henckelia pumila TaxID=405737 RepID=UPI003C6E1032
MAAVLHSAPRLQIPIKGKRGGCRLIDVSLHRNRNKKETRFLNHFFSAKAMRAGYPGKKQVWIWTEKKEAMTAAVERGWNTFIFHSHRRELAAEWSSIAVICPLFIEDGNLFDGEHRKVATYIEISSPHELEKLQSLNEESEHAVVNLLNWQVIPAENIVATIHGTRKTVFAISNSYSEAQIFLEALQHGLGGVVLKTEDVGSIFQLKDYLDRRDEEGSLLELTKARVTKVQMAGMGDRVCVDLCSIMKPGEGLLVLLTLTFTPWFQNPIFDISHESQTLIINCVFLLKVGSFARGLFLVHSECLESNYISSRPFRVNAGPVHAYVAVPGGKTSYLSELKSGKEVIVVDQSGLQRTAIVGRVKIETRQLILIEAKTSWGYMLGDQDNQTYSILLQNAETVALVASPEEGHRCTSFPVTSLKVGDEILVRVQGGARHTGIEIQEFIVEK